MANQIQDFFNEKAKDRNLVTNSNPILLYEQNLRKQTLWKTLNPKSNEYILDAGCANGRDIISLVQAKCRCVGIDLSPQMISEAQKEVTRYGFDSCQIKLLTADITNLPFPDETFDKVFASEVIEHVPNYSKAISELVRVLKKGGDLIITTPNKNGFYGFERYVLYEGLLKRKWLHPYDHWKTFKELKQVFSKNHLEITSAVTFCYLPGGAIVLHAMPHWIKQISVWISSKTEPLINKIFPRLGYSHCIKAKRLK